jgi:DNA polymerase III gamma/tau subunit
LEESGCLPYSCHQLAHKQTIDIATMDIEEALQALGIDTPALKAAAIRRFYGTGPASALLASRQWFRDVLLAKHPDKLGPQLHGSRQFDAALAKDAFAFLKTMAEPMQWDHGKGANLALADRLSSTATAQGPRTPQQRQGDFQDHVRQQARQQQARQQQARQQQARQQEEEARQQEEEARQQQQRQQQQQQRQQQQQQQQQGNKRPRTEDLDKVAEKRRRHAEIVNAKAAKKYEQMAKAEAKVQKITDELRKATERVAKNKAEWKQVAAEAHLAQKLADEATAEAKAHSS